LAPIEAALEAMRSSLPRTTFQAGWMPHTAMPWQAFLLWQRLFFSPQSTAASPMASVFMSWGMPASAAWPVAEAGVHALEATMKAAEGMQELFSSYRSEGGHATAQIVRTWKLH
jgi:hypothetical protein